MRTRTLCGVLLMCMAVTRRGHGAVKGALCIARNIPRSASLDGASAPARPSGPAHEQLRLLASSFFFTEQPARIAAQALNHAGHACKKLIGLLLLILRESGIEVCKSGPYLFQLTDHAFHCFDTSIEPLDRCP